MKRAIQPTSVERMMREDDFIVSKTNAKGIITYGNPIFIEFSGYTEDELLGSQHNIVRHPDMPRSAFKLVWDTIASGQEFFGYVKNMAKDGSFYWVFAHVTPSYSSDGKVIGYLSVRRAPRRSAIDVLADVYAAMIKEEQKASPRDACAASLALLTGILADKRTSYEELILSL